MDEFLDAALAPFWPRLVMPERLSTRAPIRFKTVNSNYSCKPSSFSFSTGLIRPKSPWDSSPIPAVK